MEKKRWTIGITHLIKPPFDPELKAFSNNVEFVYFDSKDESSFAATELESLDAMLVWTPKISKTTIDKLTNCKIVVRYGVGFDKIDRQSLATRNIAFSNNPEYGPEDVADTAMAMLLSLQRRIGEHDLKARQYTDSWQENHLSPMRQSKSTSVGIVGLGRIGTSLSLRLKPFGYRVIAYDPYVSNGMFRALNVERAHSMTELVEQIDMLSMHCPLTEETRGMFNSEVITNARNGLVFVNTARGGLIESLEMIETELRGGKLAGVGLDALPQEPPDNHSLIEAWRNNATWLAGRLLITPHNAFYSDDSMAECRFNAAKTAMLFLEQNIHRNSVDT